MTNPTDPRIEAAARALCDAAGYDPDKDYITPVNNPEMDVNWKVYAPDAEIALKAADEAAWLPIESAPVEETIDIWIESKEGGYREPAVMLDSARENWIINLDTWPALDIEATHWRAAPIKPCVP